MKQWARDGLVGVFEGRAQGCCARDGRLTSGTCNIRSKTYGRRAGTFGGGRAALGAAADVAVESVINNFEQCGLSRVLSRATDTSDGMVGLAIVAAKLRRIRLVLQRRDRTRLKAKREKRRRQLSRVAA